MTWLNEDRPWRDRLTLAVLTVLILGIFWMALPARFQGNQSFDYSCCYEAAARNWIAGSGYVHNDGAFAISYPPGFSVLLAGVFLLGRWIGDSMALNLFIAFCDVAAVLALYFAGRTVGGYWLGRIAALCLITYPFFLWMSKQPNSEVPFLPFVLWGFCGYLRLVKGGGGKWAVLTGVCLGMAALVRPIAVLAGLLIAGCLVLFGRNQSLTRRIALACGLVAANLATIAPWELIVKQETGKWILLSNNAGVGYIDGLTFGLQRLFKGATPVDADVLDLMERAAANSDRLRTTGGYLGFLKEEAQTHPGAFAKLMYIKIVRAWYATYEGYFEGVNKLVSLLYIVAACVGLWWMRRRSSSAEALGIVAMVLYFWFMSVLVLPILRYMVPATAVTMLAVGVAILTVAERVVSGRPVHPGSA